MLAGLEDLGTGLSHASPTSLLPHSPAHLGHLLPPPLHTHTNTRTQDASPCPSFATLKPVATQLLLHGHIRTFTDLVDLSTNRVPSTQVSPTCNLSPKGGVRALPPQQAVGEEVRASQSRNMEAAAAMTTKTHHCIPRSHQSPCCHLQRPYHFQPVPVNKCLGKP